MSMPTISDTTDTSVLLTFRDHLHIFAGQSLPSFSSTVRVQSWQLSVYIVHNFPGCCLERRRDPVVGRSLWTRPARVQSPGWDIIRCKNLALYIRDCESLCLSDETLKAVGPFYMVSMPGEVKYPTQGVNVSPVVDSTF